LGTITSEGLEAEAPGMLTLAHAVQFLYRASPDAPNGVAAELADITLLLILMVANKLANRASLLS